MITDAQIAGLSMAVIGNGSIETLTTAGVRNARDGAPIDQQTIFDAASLYARFLQAVLSGARLNPETARLWLSPQVTLHRCCIQCLASDMPESDTQVAWGLGWGLEPQSGRFFQWGDNDRGRFKAFAMGSLQARSAVVVFTNGFNGMSVMPELVDGTLPGAHPTFHWLNYPRFRKRMNRVAEVTTMVNACTLATTCSWAPQRFRLLGPMSASRATQTATSRRNRSAAFRALTDRNPW